MKQPFFPSTIGTQSHFAYFVTVKAMVRKFGKSDGQTGSWCLGECLPGARPARALRTPGALLLD